MYLLKTLGFAELGKYVKVGNGPRMLKGKDYRYEISYPFWGTAIVRLGSKFDEKNIEKDDDGYYRLNYITCMLGGDVTGIEIGDGFKQFNFYVNEYTPDNIEGYIIFIPKMPHIKTSGQRIFGRYPNEIVAVLREGDFLEFEDKRVEVRDSKLMLVI